MSIRVAVKGRWHSEVLTPGVSSLESRVDSGATQEDEVCGKRSGCREGGLPSATWPAGAGAVGLFGECGDE